MSTVNRTARQPRRQPRRTPPPAAATGRIRLTGHFYGSTTAIWSLRRTFRSLANLAKK